jgi:hypothetical protein
MAGKKKGTRKEETGKPISHRTATEEDYRKRQHWNVGTFHRIAPLPETETSDGAEKKTPQDPPHCPQELVKALRK